MRKPLLLIGAVALSSCGASDAPRVDPQPAVSAGTGFAALPDVVRGGDGRAAAGAAAEGVRGILGVVEPVFRPQGGEVAELGTTGLCECDEGGCQFQGCDAGEAQVSGALTASDDTFSFDLELTFPFTGGTVVAQCEGTLTITSEQLSGSASCEAQVDDDTTLTADILFDVVLEDGCPVDGEIEISARFESPAGSFTIETEVEFSGSCGGATLDDDDSDSEGESDSASDSLSESDDSDSDSSSDVAEASDSDSDSEDSTSESNSDGDSMDDSDDDDSTSGGDDHGGDDADGGVDDDGGDDNSGSGR